jgi:glutathione synthase/RimK-type ligase-like ATP-grasp enzyme
MNVFILGGSQPVTDKDRTYYQEYIDFFKASGATAEVEVTAYSALLQDLIISVGDGNFSIYDAHNNKPLEDYDVIFIRASSLRNSMDVVASVSEYASLKKIPVINDVYRARTDSSKLLQAVHFALLDIPVAETLYVTDAIFESNRIKDWKFPCIMKASHGSHGNDNFVVESLAEVKEKKEALSDKAFVLQRFVPNDGDLRILIVGDEVRIIGRSAAEGSHLNNTSQGGEAILIDEATIPIEVIEQSRRIMEYRNLTIAGVDVIPDKNTHEYFFLEVNSQAQLISGAFLDEKKAIVGKLLKKLDDR